MQRNSFDVNSIAALLRQTEANLSALSRPPVREEPRYLSSTPSCGSVAWAAPAEPAAAACCVAPVQVHPKILQGGHELELQVSQLRGCLELLEKKLEDELRSFLSVSDKRLQAREEQLRGVGDTLQASADATYDQLSRRVDQRLRELDRAGQQAQSTGLDEVWESVKRVQADCRNLEGRVLQLAPADELAERLREADRAQQQRLEERLAGQERRLLEHRSQLESGTEAWREAMGRRCDALEQRVWEGSTDRGEVAEVVLKRLPEAQVIRELQEELRASVYDKEVQQRRLSAAEAKLSKLAALESKVDFVETHTAQQLEEQAQANRGLGEMAQKLSQKLSQTEAACQRVESQSSALQARLQAQLDEDRERFSDSQQELQQHLSRRLDEAEGRLSRMSARMEKDVTEQFAGLGQKIQENVTAVQREAERKIRVLEERSEALSEASQKQLQRASDELRAEAKAQVEALEMQLARQERSVQDVLTKMTAQDLLLARISDFEVQRSRVDAIEGRLQDLQVEQRREINSTFESLRTQVETRTAASEGDQRRAGRELKASLESMHSQVESRMATFEGSLVALEAEQKVARELRASIDSLRTQVESRIAGLEGSLGALEVGEPAMRSRLDATELRLTELQVTGVRAQSGLDSLKASLHSLEPLRASVSALEADLAACQEQLRTKGQDWAFASQAAKAREEVLSTRITECGTNFQKLQTGLDGLKASTAGLESRSEQYASWLSSMETVVQSIQDRLGSGVTQPEPGPDQPSRNTELQLRELIAVSEARAAQRVNRELEALRSELLVVKSKLLEGSEASSSTTADLEGKLGRVQDTLATLRAEMGTSRADAQESATREARRAAELKALSDLVAGLQQELRDSAARAVTQAQLQQTVQLVQQRSETSFLSTSSLDAREVGAEPPSPAGVRSAGVQDPKVVSTSAASSSVKLAGLEARLKRAEELLEPLPRDLAERLRLLEPPTLLSTVRAALEPTFAELRKGLERLDIEQRRAQQAAASSGPSAPEAAPSMDTSDIEARLSRLEDELVTLRSLEPSDLGPESLLVPGAATAPPESSLVLTLSWADGVPEPPTSQQDRLVNALRGAVSTPGLDVLRVDVSGRGGGDGGAPSTPGSPPRGTICWLSAADAPAAEAEIRRQLTDPSSALRRMLPGLVAEDSSAMLLPPAVSAAVVAQTRVLASRVIDLEKSSDLLAKDLGDVERRVLQVEAAFVGVPSGSAGFGASSRHASGLGGGMAGPQALGDLSDLQEELVGIGIRPGAISQPMRASIIGAGAASLRRGNFGGADSSRTPTPPSREEFTHDAEDSSRELDFVGASLDSAANLPTEPIASAALAEERRRREAAAEAERAARLQKEREKAEEEVRARRVAEAEAEAERIKALREKEQAEEADRQRKAREEQEERQRQAEEEEAERRRAEAAAAKREADDKAAREEAERQAEEQRRRQLQKEEEDRAAAAAAADAERERLQAEQLAREAEEEAREARVEQGWAVLTGGLVARNDEDEAVSIQETQQRTARARAAWPRLAKALLRQLEQEETQARLAAKKEASKAAAEKDAEKRRRQAVSQPTVPPAAGQVSPTAGTGSGGVAKAASPTSKGSRRERVKGRSLVARASHRSKDEEIRKAFDDMDSTGQSVLSLDDVLSYLCDYLGFGQMEARRFYENHSSGDDGVSFDEFKKGYKTLNPYNLEQRRGELLIRKPGSLGGEQVNLNLLEDCEVYVCDPTSQIFADFCKRCVVMLGPCESSVYIRDCEDCVFWLATKQFRTSNCQRCTFHLYAKTEPIIESSVELAFAPWSAGYPACKEHFEKFSFDPTQNFWNAIFDFSGKSTQANWRILRLDEVTDLNLELDEPPGASKEPENPVQPVTHKLLVDAPLASGESCGQGIADIPQTRPSLPAPPPASFEKVFSVLVRDMPEQDRPIGPDGILSKASATKAAQPAAEDAAAGEQDEAAAAASGGGTAAAAAAAASASFEATEISSQESMGSMPLESADVSAAAPGASLPPDSSELSSVTVAGAEICPSCENRYMPDSRFCRNCGRERDVDHCPVCSNIYAADAVFCRKCGHKRGEAAAPTTVQGGMTADSDEDSSDGEAPSRQPDSSAITASPPPFPAEPVTAAVSTPPPVVEPVTAVSPPTASPSEETKKEKLREMLGEDSSENDDAESPTPKPSPAAGPSEETKKVQLREMLGEDSSENDDADSPPPKPSPAASLGLSGGLASLAKGKAAPKAKSLAAQRPWQAAVPAEGSSEEEDVEEILKRDLAEKTSLRSPSRSSSTGSLTQPKPAPSGPPPRVGLAGSAEANSISLLSLGASSPGQEPPGDRAAEGGNAVAAPEGSNSWDSESDASPSPTAKKALGLDSPSLSPATSPTTSGPKSGAPAGIAPPAAAASLEPESLAGIAPPAATAASSSTGGVAPPAASSATPTSPAGIAPPGAKAAAQLASPAGNQGPDSNAAQQSSGGAASEDAAAEEVSDEYDSDAFDEADDLPI